MNLIRRFFASVATLAVMLSSNAGSFVVIAEGTTDSINDLDIMLDNDLNADDTYDIDEDTEPIEVITLDVDIPEHWSKSINEWTVTTDEEAVLYYKTNSVNVQEEEWGTYTDDNAKLWNNGDDLDEGDGFIKFWAVKTVGEESAVAKIEAVHFMYDKTSPDSFRIEKVKVGDNEYAIRNANPIKDEISKVNSAYYIINPKNIESVEDIKKLGTKIELNEKGDYFSFSFPCTKEMNESTVNVYVIDNAGNIQLTSIGIDTYKDLYAPELTVNGIKSQWVNSTIEWDIHSDSVGAKVYYKTSNTELENWGSYTDFDVKEWITSSEIPEGDRFIHFWAAYDDEERECAEKTTEYMYDATAPSDFSIKYEHEGGHWDNVSGWNEPRFIVYGSGISDTTSGINMNRIYYTVKQNGNEFEQGTVERKNQTINDDGTISFTLDLSKGEWLNNANVTFYIVDNAGNKTACILDDEAVSYDPFAPIIFTDKESLCITASADENAVPLELSFYGTEELENCWYSVYANGDCYLKLTIEENDLREIVVTIDDKKSVIFTDDGRDNTPRWSVLEDDNNSQTKVYFLKLSDFEMSENEKHSLSIIAKDSQNSSEKALLTSLADEMKVEYTVWYDPLDDDDSVIKFSSENEKIINGKKYYGNDFEDNILISLYDDNGIKNYSVDIAGPEGFNKNTGIVDLSEGNVIEETYEKEIEITDADGESVSDDDNNVKTEVITKVVSYNIPYRTFSCTEFIDNVEYKYDGKYVVTVNVEDLAGNIKIETYEFYIDTTSPIIKEERYTYNPSILNYLSFGIFGNNTIDITIEVEDNDNGCGINDDSIFLYWGDNKVSGKLIENDDVKEYVFENLPVGGNDIPYITLADMLDNYSNYYFTTEDERLANQNIITQTHITLENNKPTAKIILPEENQYTINGEIWYPSSFDYDITAIDKDSGLNNISVKENIFNDYGLFETMSDVIEKGVVIDNEYTNFAEMADKFNKEAKYQYHIEEEGNYQIAVDVQDNAGNKSSDPDNSNIITQMVHVDNTNPEIIEFMFSDQNDNVTDIERGTYGFYFVDDTKVKVFVEDYGNSSGINYVTLYYRDANGITDNVTVYSSDAENYHVENGIAYAEFTIEKGFKGQIWALVADNVASENPFEDDFNHTSGFRYADGNIVENPELHQSMSKINISANIEPIKKLNSNNIPIYNKSIPLTINVQDSFSGISVIEWSVENDGSSGVISVANDGSYKSDSELATISDDSIITDSNLVTNLSFNITVSSNTDANKVHIKFKDRAGNESEETKYYSIDTTMPTISAFLSNQEPSKEIYYNTKQTITISITERNFDASDVKFILNGDEQVIDDWTSNDEGDATVNIGTFTIDTDGDYSFFITFTDMAGNVAEPYKQSMFVIDKTAPVLKTNFDEFKTPDEEHYFGIDSINKTAKITIIEHNFSSTDANVVVFKKKAGSEHSFLPDDDNKKYNYGWIDNGDEHILEITFKENDDGVYLIKAAPVDLASNSTESQETVVFEIDFKNPIISERNGLYVNDEEESYENLEIYNVKTGVEKNFIPSITFSDANFDHLEYDLTIYTPEYSNEKEIGVIVPKTDSGIISETFYSLPEFKKDGVYSVDITAVDKAKNRSILCRNTSVLMMNSEVLAYISNSNKAEGTGWYSLQKDENTPISKRPDSFSDLDITVFAQEDSETSIILRDKNGESEDTGITAENNEDMYAVGVYNYTLPKEYFVDNYPEGTNEDFYLWTENTLDNETSHNTLGWIRIDALAPTCNIPADLKVWWKRAYVSWTKTITLSDISESLDKSQCVVYDNGQAILADDFDYSDETDTLSYTLEKGWHNLSFVLVDEAGNALSVQEIPSIQVGLIYCWWFIVLCVVIAVIGIAVAVHIIKKKKFVSK